MKISIALQWSQLQLDKEGTFHVDMMLLIKSVSSDPNVHSDVMGSVAGRG